MTFPRYPFHTTRLASISLVVGMCYAVTNRADGIEDNDGGGPSSPLFDPGPIQPARPAVIKTEPQRPAGLLVDEGDIFSPSVATKIEQQLKKLHRDQQVAIYLFTTNYLFNESSYDCARRLLRIWLGSEPGIVVVYDRASGKLTSSAAMLGLTDQEVKNLLNAVHQVASSPSRAATPADILEGNIHNLVAAVTKWKETGKVPVAPASEVPAERVPTADSVSGSVDQTATANQSSLGAPEGYLIDECNLFTPESAANFSAILKAYQAKEDVHVYVVALSYISELDATTYAEHLAALWMKGKLGAILVYNRGVLDTAKEDAIGIAGVPDTERWLTPFTMSQCILKAKETARKAIGDGGAGSTAVERAASSLMADFTRLGNPIREAVAQTTSPVQLRAFSAVTAALCVGSGLLYMFHRYQERNDRKVKAHWLFPDIQIDPRLGASHGGGLVAMISYALPDPNAAHSNSGPLRR